MQGGNMSKFNTKIIFFVLTYGLDPQLKRCIQNYVILSTITQP
jgi:hypothetical protein